MQKRMRPMLNGTAMGSVVTLRCEANVQAKVQL
jgi:hypothetical protein